LSKSAIANQTAPLRMHWHMDWNAVDRRCPCVALLVDGFGLTNKDWADQWLGKQKVTQWNYPIRFSKLSPAGAG